MWNEGNSVRQHKALDEALRVVIEVDTATVDTSNEGKLVHFVGEADTNSTVMDSTFGVSDKVLKLRRNVEIYQWVEEEHSETKKNTGGSTTTTTTYTYNKEWRSTLVSSTTFQDPTGHENPSSMEFSSQEWDADPIVVGGYTIPTAIKNKMNWFQPTGSSISLDNIPDETIRSQAQMYGNGFYLGSSPAFPEIGDMKISFDVVPQQVVSVVAKQIGDSLSAYTASSGGTVLLVESGPHDVTEMFLHANQALNFQTWLIRVGGFVLLWVSFMAVLGPLSVFADVLPILGNIVEAGTCCIAFISAAITATTTIAVSWLAFRPIVSLSLFAVVGGMIYFVKQRHGAKSGSGSDTSIPVATVVDYEMPSMGVSYKDDPDFT